MNTQTLSAHTHKVEWLKTIQYKHATAVTAITFAIAGVTGVMVFFHLGNSYVMSLHEWLGMAMVVAAVFHVTRHIQGLSNQLKKPRARVWLAAGALVTAVFVGSALLAPSGGNPIKGFARKSMDAPLSTIGAVLQVSNDDVQARLEAAGIQSVQLDMSINQVATSNHMEATVVLAAVMGQR